MITRMDHRSIKCDMHESRTGARPALAGGEGPGLCSKAILHPILILMTTEWAGHQKKLKWAKFLDCHIGNFGLPRPFQFISAMGI